MHLQNAEALWCTQFSPKEMDILWSLLQDVTLQIHQNRNSLTSYSTQHKSPSGSLSELHLPWTSPLDASWHSSHHTTRKSLNAVSVSCACLALRCGTRRCMLRTRHHTHLLKVVQESCARLELCLAEPWSTLAKKVLKTRHLTGTNIVGQRISDVRAFTEIYASETWTVQRQTSLRTVWSSENHQGIRDLDCAREDIIKNCVISEDT